MPNNIRIGQIGEELACQYLLNNKYEIIDRNYREKWGEVDIICKDRDGVLVFVEVKTLRKSDFLNPEENLHSSKLKKIKRTAYLYANSHPELINNNKGWQIDLVAIEINCENPESLATKELLKLSTIRHYENI
ncbi:MAG: YraN family protein [Patescibacteria group bacterium]|mgnify:CR=1 FL=1